MPASRVGIYTGSFDPLTLGHLDIIQRAAKLFDKLIVAVGIARDKKTLFSLEERILMITEVCHPFPNVIVQSFEGLAVNFALQHGAHTIVRGMRSSSDYVYEVTMAQMNRAMAPNLDTILLPTSPSLSHISSSLAKEVVALGGDPLLMCPPDVALKLKTKLTKL